MALVETAKRQWRAFWLVLAGLGPMGRFAARMTCLGTLPFQGRAQFAVGRSKGFVDPGARLDRTRVALGEEVYLGQGVVILTDKTAEAVQFEDQVALYGDTFIQCGQGGRLVVGKGTHIQPGCHFRAYLSEIVIGEKVEIAASCSFYCFSHGAEVGKLIMEQELVSKGPIEIGDGAWLGHGVTVLEGVTIGAGAIVGAGSVVNKDIPENAVAVGVPAKVIRYRR